MKMTPVVGLLTAASIEHGQATLMASGSTGEELTVVNSVPLAQLVRPRLPGVLPKQKHTAMRLTSLTT